MKSRRLHVRRRARANGALRLVAGLLSSLLLNSHALGEGAAILHVRSDPPAADMRAALGSLDMAITCPPVRDRNADGSGAAASRWVDITVREPNPNYRRFIQPILKAGVRATFEQCPANGPQTQDDPFGAGGIATATVHVTDDQGSSQVAVVASEYQAATGRWETVDDLGSQRAWKATPEARPNASAEVIPDSPTPRARAVSVSAPSRATPEVSGTPYEEPPSGPIETTPRPSLFASFFDFLWKFVALLSVGAALIAAIINEVPIKRFWYGLTPHPAERLVAQSITHGLPIDIETLTEALKAKPRNAVEHAVREAQLARATSQLDAHRNSLNAREAARLDAFARQAEQEAKRERAYDLGEAELTLLKATLNHEVAAARADALDGKRSPR